MSSNFHTPHASPTSTELSALEERCYSVKNRIGEFASPWFVEFAGLPRAGKSTAIETVGHFLERNNFFVLAPTEGATRVPEFIKEGSLIAYNVWTATYAIREILEGRYYRGPHKYDIVLLDRGLFDAMAWFHHLENDNKLTADERKFMTKFVRVNHWSAPIKQVFLFLCSPEQSQEREFKNKLTKKHGTTTKEKFLKKLRAVYDNCQECYRDEFNIIRIETDSISPSQVAFQVIQDIFDGIESQPLSQ